MQILIAELCFNICCSIEIIPGRGNDFLPYYHNLNFIKGIISLHSLLLSERKNELSIKNYITEYKKSFPEKNIENFESNISRIVDLFKNIYPLPLRHNIAAHIADKFKHQDFTCAYILPTLASKYFNVAEELKNIFFEFCNYSRRYNPLERIKNQSDMILASFKSKSG